LYDARHQLHLELANESHPELADVYSTKRSDNTLKLAPDALMADLIRDLSREGFDKLATDGEPPSIAPGRGWVTVQQGDRTRTYVVPAETVATAEQLGAFTRMKLWINEYYSHLGALQFIDNPQGAAIFKGKGP
jgi:hypothetical protein